MTTSAWWAIPMLICGGLFAGGVAFIAWERIPAWRSAELQDFRTVFAHTLRRADRLQPGLVVVSLLSTLGFAVAASGAARVFALLAAVGFLVVLVGSAAWLVPIQRRLVGSGPDGSSPELERLRALSGFAATYPRSHRCCRHSIRASDHGDLVCLRQAPKAIRGWSPRWLSSDRGRCPGGSAAVRPPQADFLHGCSGSGSPSA